VDSILREQKEFMVGMICGEVGFKSDVKEGEGAMDDERGDSTEEIEVMEGGRAESGMK